jgi:Fe-S-cluster containining protein
VTPLEAFDFLDAIEALPAERRAAVERRFEETKERVEAAGLVDALRRAIAGERVEVSAEYFALGIPCPFLEDRACMIYDRRPFVCREYLVSSAPHLCDNPLAGSVAPVFVPVDMVRAVGNLTRLAWGEAPRRMPLIWALDWARAHPELRAQGAPGTELFPALLDMMQLCAPTLEEATGDETGAPEKQVP